MVARIVKLWLQGDRSRLGLRGSASSEFVPTLSKRDESEVIFPQEIEEHHEGQRGVQTEDLTLNRLSGGQVSITLERQQTPRRLGGVLVANEQVVGPPCTARSVNLKSLIDMHKITQPSRPHLEVKILTEKKAISIVL